MRFGYVFVMMAIAAFLLAPFVPGCAATEEEIATLSSNPNTVQNVNQLVTAASNLLGEAINQAEGTLLKVLVLDPNGDLQTRDVTQELKDVKAALDKTLK